MHVLLHHIPHRVSGRGEETQNGSSLLRSLFNYINSLGQNLGFSWVQYEAGNDLPWRLKKIPT
jgi:hypothetical protein